MASETVEAASPVASAVPVERRRPGRPAHVSPELVGLLRFRAANGAGDGSVRAAGTGSQGRDVAEGLMLGSLGGAALWGGLLLVARHLLG